MDPNSCKNCGYDLSKIPDYDPNQDVQCPKCSKNTLQANVVNGVKAGEHLSLLKKREGKVTGFSESERQGRSSGAEQNKDGSLSYTLKGPSPQGEEDTFETCRRLITVLNQKGAKWENLAKGEEPADYVATDREDPTQKLSIQVTRAIVDQKLWSDLNYARVIAESNINRDKLADELKASIEKKANERKIPKSSRSEIILALDANRLPAVAFDSVTDSFQQQYGEWAWSLGFHAIWLVGPDNSLTIQLDTQQK